MILSGGTTLKQAGMVTLEQKIAERHRGLLGADELEQDNGTVEKV